MHGLDRPGDGFTEPRPPGRDQLGISGEGPGELRRRLAERPSAVERFLPAIEIGIGDETQPRRIVGDLPREEAFGIPAVKDVADIEDDCGGLFGAGRSAPFAARPGLRSNLAKRRIGGRQPWRALKRRFVLLMT
jgi:hypothetical protein